MRYKRQVSVQSRWAQRRGTDWINRAGRPKGTKNKVTRVLKEAILIAAEQVGCDKKGTGGIVGYLRTLAISNPKTFAGLLGRVIPMQITGKDDGPIQVLALDPDRLKGLSDTELGALEKVFHRIQTGRPVEQEQTAVPERYENTLH